MALIWERICHVFCKFVHPILRYEQARKAEPSRYPYFNFLNEVRTTALAMRSNLRNNRNLSSDQFYIRKALINGRLWNTMMMDDQKEARQPAAMEKVKRKRVRTKCKRKGKSCRKTYTRKPGIVAAATN